MYFDHLFAVVETIMEATLGNNSNISCRNAIWDTCIPFPSDNTWLNSQFNGFIPHDDIAWESKWLHIDNVNVSSFGSHVEPFTLERQMTKRYPEKK